MTRPLLLLATTALALSGCAQQQPARTVFISAPGVHSHAHGGGPVVVHRGDRRSRVIVIRESGDHAMSTAAQADALRRGEAARRHAREAVRMARLHRPDPDEIARLTREARAAGEAGRRAGELARRHGEQVRRHADEIRRNAQRLREQCERGEIACEIIITE